MTDKFADHAETIGDHFFLAQAISVYFGGQWLPTKIYDRSQLVPGNRVDGPAIVTEFDSTTVVLAGYAAEVDRYLNLIINPKES